MSDINDMQKTLEVKIRNKQIQDRQDQKDVSRVFFSRDALLELGLANEQACYLWKIDDPEPRKRQVVAWLAPQKDLNKKVIQLSKSFQEICGFKLEDRIAASPCGHTVVAEEVALRDTTDGIPELSEEDKIHWEWHLEDKLGRAEHVFHGMKFEITARGPRRTFTVESFISNGKVLPDTLARFTETSKAAIVYESSLPVNQPAGPRPPLKVDNIEGIDRALVQLNQFLSRFDRPSRRHCAALLHGSKGTGKTMLLERVCKTGWGQVFHITDQSKPQTVRDLFADARRGEPSIIAIDDIEHIVSKENAKSNELEKAIDEEMEKLSLRGQSAGQTQPRVVVLATTSTPNDIPGRLRKRGRFTREIILPVPDVDARKKILRSMAPNASKAELALLDHLGERTYAYTPEDLGLLLDEAYDISLDRNSEECLTQECIDQALLIIRPTAMHDVTLQPPKVRWDEIGGQESVKKALRQAVESPLLYPELIKRVGTFPKKGILLYGPPGCSKTLSAQAMATETGFNFFAVKGAELLNKYVGESERAIRDVFSRARAASPSIVFFDEIESIASKRETSGRNNGVNVLTTLLNEMDGIETLKGVLVLAATNKPELIDLALLRPGRFDDLHYVAPPEQSDREHILRLSQKKMDWADDVDISRLAELMDGFSGAEIVGVCQKAGERVVAKALETKDLGQQIRMNDFTDVLKTVKRRITPELIERYKRWGAGDGDILDGSISE